MSEARNDATKRAAWVHAQVCSTAHHRKENVKRVQNATDSGKGKKGRHRAPRCMGRQVKLSGQTPNLDRVAACVPSRKVVLSPPVCGAHRMRRCAPTCSHLNSLQKRGRSWILLFYSFGSASLFVCSSAFCGGYTLVNGRYLLRCKTCPKQVQNLKGFREIFQGIHLYPQAKMPAVSNNAKKENNHGTPQMGLCG